MIGEKMNNDDIRITARQKWLNVFVWIVMIYSTCIFNIALWYRDWIGILINLYPLNLISIYLITRKQLNIISVNVIVTVINTLYLIYIWTPLTDGTIGNMIRETIKQ